MLNGKPQVSNSTKNYNLLWLINFAYLKLFAPDKNLIECLVKTVGTNFNKTGSHQFYDCCFFIFKLLELLKYLEVPKVVKKYLSKLLKWLIR
jgi:transposase